MMNHALVSHWEEFQNAVQSRTGPRRTRGTLAAVVLLALAGVSRAGVAGGINLLVNPSFEPDLTGWNVLVSTASVVSYGTSGVPGSAVAVHIGGGFRLLRDMGGSAIVEQVVPIGPVPPGTNLRVGGYFGGTAEDDARLVVRYLNASGVEIGLHNLNYVTREMRNLEPVLVLQEELLSIPAGTESVAARVEFRNNCCSAASGAVDALFLELVTTPLIPDPLPLEENLLENPRFEEGWTSASPLSLNDPRGWYGSNAAVVVKPYSDADPLVPGEDVSCIVTGGEPGTSCSFGGAGNLLSDSGGGGVLWQRLDVRGNAAQIAGGLQAHVSALLGGYFGEDDTARVDLRFLRNNLTLIGTITAVGPVSSAARNSETVVVRRERELVVPANTAYIEVQVAFVNACCSGARGLADNISVVLHEPVDATGVPLNNELIANGGFEEGSLPGSPLQLDNPTGWFGSTSAATEVLEYDTSSIVPSQAFAQANGLGELLLGDSGGGAVLRQSIDLTGSHDAIYQGRISVYAEAWLGGVGNEADSAELHVRFTTSAGAQLGLFTLGPVTNLDRGNVTTLLRRSSQFPIPGGSARMEVEVQFNNACCSGTLALADGISVVVYDEVTGGPLLYPGSRGDLRLLTGVNASPTTGPGQDVKTARLRDALNVRVRSPDGGHDFAPMMLAANLFPTGMRPTLPKFGFPGLVLDPAGMIRLADGVGCTGFGCTAVLPGGTNFTFVVPPGLSGSSLLMQAFVRTTSPAGPRAAFVASEAHEIRIVP